MTIHTTACSNKPQQNALKMSDYIPVLPISRQGNSMYFDRTPGDNRYNCAHTIQGDRIYIDKDTDHLLQSENYVDGLGLLNYLIS